MTNGSQAAEASGGDAKKRHRLQLDFSPKAFQRLQRIRALAETSSNALLVTRALRLYEWFVEELNAGWRIQLKRGDEVKEVELLLGDVWRGRD